MEDLYGIGIYGRYMNIIINKKVYMEDIQVQYVE